MAIVALRLSILALAGFALPAMPALASDGNCPEGRGIHLAGCVDIETVMAADLQLSGAWIGAMKPDETTARAYLTILNRGETPDRLLGATSPAADRVDLWDGERIEEGVAIDPGHRADLKPGGLHLILSKVDGRLRQGGEVEVTLEFEKAGSAVVTFPVREPVSRVSAAR